MSKNDKKLNGIVLDGKFYEAVDLTEEAVSALINDESNDSLCNHCDIQDYCMGFSHDRCRLLCDKVPFPHENCYTILCFSKPITDKINIK